MPIFVINTILISVFIVYLTKYKYSNQVNEPFKYLNHEYGELALTPGQITYLLGHMYVTNVSFCFISYQITLIVFSQQRLTY